jgi:hypothetical protein
MGDESVLLSRLEDIERRARRARTLAAGAIIGLLATWLVGAGFTPRKVQDGTLRTRILVIEDEDGRDRIVLGAPMPDGRQVTGMKILNPEGWEQFGLSLKHDGGVSMGFDAQPGVGDQRNPERLNLGVTATGQGWIRYLDNQTRARLWVQLDSEDEPWVRFLDWSDQEIAVRKIGFSGEQTEVIER